MVMGLLISNTMLTSSSADKLTAADMFSVNADRLLDIKRKYDPANVFNKLNPLDRSL
jgi:FAD/FMN-containing dehydrogenase